MDKKLIQGITIDAWKKQYPLMDKIISTEEVFWTNPKYERFEEAIKKISLSEKDVKDAEERLKRFAPYIAKVFPETEKTNGIIESPIVKISNMQDKMKEVFDQEIIGQLLLKCDSHLAISGSIKARGGIYEVLKHAEDLATQNNMLTLEDDYSILDNDKFREFFSQYSIAVGSTGNLGLSIGIMSAQLGFKVYVHMSADAKKWKKDLLRSKGVTVIEYESDYSKAVEEGRKQAESDPKMYFVDDENSTNLFLGYAVAAYRLKKQLKEINVVVDEEHPLFVYLPCGVGGGPGGVAFGLKLVFKDNVHCFFAEPTHSPCMLLGLMTDLHDKVCVQDFEIDNITDADGLAVGRPSGFVGKTLEDLISGSYTVKDEELYRMLSILSDSEDIKLEPSALAGLYGSSQIFKDVAGQKYIEDNNLKDKMAKASHIAWATGGSMVPKDVMDAYYKKGRDINIIQKLMEEYKRPIYIYDESVIAKQIETLKEKLPQFEFLYSIKTNPYEPIVDSIVSKGFGSDAASAKEVNISKKAGLNYEKILYSAPGKTHQDIEETIDKAIIVADSYNELNLINNIAKQRGMSIKVGIRINPDYNMDSGKGISSKFGVDEETLINQKSFLEGLTNIKIIGIHVHVRSQILEHSTLYKYYEKVFELALFCKESMGWDLEFVNFGGGIGIPYSNSNDVPLNFELLSEECKTLVEKFKDKMNVRLIIETGRFLVCQAGKYITQIIDIKESRGTKYLIVANSLNGFLRPSIAEFLSSYMPQGSKLQGCEPLFTSKDAFEFIILKSEKASLEKVSIVGNLCTSADIMAKDIMLPKASIGDILMVSNAGSYSYTLTPVLFAGQPLPMQVYVKVNGEICVE